MILKVRVLRHKLQKLSQLQRGTDISTSLGEAKALELNERLKALTRQHSTFREEMVHRMQRKDQVMQQLQKERRAIQTIMERKIKALTDNIAVALAQISKTPMSTSQNANGNMTSPTQRLSREVSALQRLVDAAITALRNAETSAHARGDGVSA